MDSQSSVMGHYAPKSHSRQQREYESCQQQSAYLAGTWQQALWDVHGVSWHQEDDC